MLQRNEAWEVDLMSLVVFLEVSSAKSKKKLGTLQMLHSVGPQGQVSQGWEWVGVNATYDGGFWQWKKARDNGKVWAELTSTNDPDNMRLVARLLKSGWDNGPVPPNVPWFDFDPYEWGDGYEPMEYYGPKGTQKQYARWTHA